MKPIALIGIALIVLGVLVLAYQGITYVTQEPILDVGPLRVEAERERTIPLPPILGAAALIGGVILILLGFRRV